MSRPKVVQFSLTKEEFEEVSVAAARSGLARGAFAADVTLAAARGTRSRAGSPLREALVEVIAAAGLVRRVGTNLNQAVARLNATGERGDDLLPAAQFCVRVIRRLDEAAKKCAGAFRDGMGACRVIGKVLRGTDAGGRQSRGRRRAEGRCRRHAGMRG